MRIHAENLGRTNYLSEETSNDLVIHRRAHRTGTGRALLDTAVAAAHALGRRPVIDMADNLLAARRLYEDTGWAEVGAYDLDLSGHHLHVITWVGPEA
jgi:GNAT superfamily N-acetyltransferase